MSYKFWTYRCDTCGVVWFDPPFMRNGNAVATDTFPCPLHAPLVTDDDEPGHDRPHPVLRTRCDGTVRLFAFIDTDSFTHMARDWDG